MRFASPIRLELSLGELLDIYGRWRYACAEVYSRDSFIEWPSRRVVEPSSRKINRAPGKVTCRALFLRKISGTFPGVRLESTIQLNTVARDSTRASWSANREFNLQKVSRCKRRGARRRAGSDETSLEASYPSDSLLI